MAVGINARSIVHGNGSICASAVQLSIKQCQGSHH